MKGLWVENLKVTNGGFGLSVPKLQVAPGEIVCVMGKSGSGKSTLLNGISGFFESSGKIGFGEQRLESLPIEKRRMAFVFQRPALFPHLSVLGNVEFAMKLQNIGQPERSEKAKKWLRRLGIEELSQRFPREVSEGQAQRVSFARALATGFPVLLLDEPFSALDVSTRKQLREALSSLVKESGVSALLVTHHPEDALVVADRIVLLNEGQVVWEGTAEEARKAEGNPLLKEFFS